MTNSTEAQPNREETESSLQGDDVTPISLDQEEDALENGAGQDFPNDQDTAGEYTAPIAEAQLNDTDSDETPEQPDDEISGHEVSEETDNGSATVETEDSEEESATLNEPEEEDDFEDDPDSRTILEALIFASDEPLTFKQIREILENGSKKQQSERSDDEENEDAEPEPAPAEPSEEPAPEKNRPVKLSIAKVRRWVDIINSELSQQNRPFRIVEVAGGFAFQTISEYGQYVGRLYAERSKRRLTQSALETLAIIAYKQPISKPGVEAIRGVSADYVIKSLLEKGLIAIVGREDTVGRPLLYGTTKQFLKHFGLNNIGDLPKPREIEELLKENEEELAPSIEISDDPMEFPPFEGEPSIFDDVQRPAPEPQDEEMDLPEDESGESNREEHHPTPSESGDDESMGIDHSTLESSEAGNDGDATDSPTEEDEENDDSALPENESDDNDDENETNSDTNEENSGADDELAE